MYEFSRQDGCIMSNYFEDVYLKRMNRDGNSIQERVQTRKEKEFDQIFLKKTKYQANIYMCNDEHTNILCSLSPNKWGQDKILSNLMVSNKENKMKTGDIVYTYQKVKEKILDKTWLIVFVSDDITHGYQLYWVIELDNILNLTDEYGRTLHTIPIKFVNETSVFVQDKFSSYGAVSYREPLAHKKFLTQDFNFLKKTTYFNYKNRGWEIVGIDNISIDNIAYVSIAEHLVREPEPLTSEDIMVGEDDNFFLNHKGV